jgi:hypothetical protein
MSVVVHSHGYRSLEVVWDASSEEGDEASMRNCAQEDRFQAILTDHEGSLRRLVSAYERDIDQQEWRIDIQMTQIAINRISAGTTTYSTSMNHPAFQYGWSGMQMPMQPSQGVGKDRQPLLTRPLTLALDQY